MDTFNDHINDLIEYTFLKKKLSFLTQIDYKLYFHERVISFLLLNTKYVFNFLSINKFMILECLFYIVIHKLFENIIH